MSGIAEFRKYLPARISDAVSLLPQGISQTASELRLRAGMPASVTVGERNLLFDTSGRACGGANALRATRAELLECVSKLTRGSLYSCENAVSMGYIPLPEGGRAGICGRAKVSAGRVECFSEITSVNLRVHRFVPDLRLRLRNITVKTVSAAPWCFRRLPAGRRPFSARRHICSPAGWGSRAGGSA